MADHPADPGAGAAQLAPEAGGEVEPRRPTTPTQIGELEPTLVDHLGAVDTAAAAPVQPSVPASPTPTAANTGSTAHGGAVHRACLSYLACDRALREEGGALSRPETPPRLCFCVFPASLELEHIHTAHPLIQNIQRHAL